MRYKTVMIEADAVEARGRRPRRRAAGFARLLALAAMLVQFAASYGHMHPEDFYRLLGSHGATIVAMPSGNNTPIPAGPDEDGCDICQVMHMAAGSALPPPVVLAIPSESIAAPAVEISDLLLSPPAYFLFRTRAPPIA